MSGKNTSRGNNQNPVDTELIKSFLEVQNQKAQNELKHLEIEKERLGHDFKLANKTLDIQGAFIKQEPKEKRTTLVYISVICVVVLLIVLNFMFILITKGHKDIAQEIAQWSSYFIVAIVSYFAGKKSKSQKGDDTNPDEIEDAEIIP
ncbi:MAG: hypothetical protein AB3N14_18175 [Flavobacteriaceae bacterium]